MGKSGQDAVSCLFWSVVPMWTRGHACWGPCVWVLWDSGNWALCLPSHLRPGESCFPWLLFSGLTFLGPLRHQRDLGGRGRSGALNHLRRPLCLPLWPSFLPFLALSATDKTNPGSPRGRRLTNVRWQAGSEGRSLSPQGSRWDVEFFYGHAWTPESPQTDSHLCSVDHIFSRHFVIPSTLPKCFGLPYFYDPSSKRRSVESGSAWFISEEKGWRVSYLWYQEVGFPSYHPVSFALGF